MTVASEVAVVGTARTPFGKFGGVLRDVSLASLGATAVGAALSRAGVPADAVDEMAIGVNFPGADRSIARQIQLRSGVPEDRVAYTIDRACCSSLNAITHVARSIRLGEANVGVAGGAENLSAVPYFLEGVRWGHRRGDIVMSDKLVVSCPHTHVPRAQQASNEAARYGVDRESQDLWALRSQLNCAKAVANGAFDDEIVPVEVVTEHHSESLAVDECPRPHTTIERLRALPTVNGSATVTAGSAPDLSTGASALVLASAEHVAAPLAVLRGFAMTSGPPEQIASVPARAARMALTRSGLALDDIDLFEINEAFAAVPLVATLELADGDRQLAEHLRERTNVNGGAIALGHPTGATGGRLVLTMIAELRRRGGGRGLVTMCGGIGEAEALIVEVADGEAA
jgi:acetyl-CoA C-acetyltransferase